MTEVIREFNGGVWHGQARAVREDTTAVLAGVPILNPEPNEADMIWTGYQLRAGAFYEAVTGSESECRRMVDAVKSTEGAD